MIDVYVAFADKLAADYGIHVNPQDLVADGKLRHATPEGERPRSKKLAYKIHDDDRPVGWFEHYPTGQKGSFSLAERKPMTEAERAEARRRWAKQRAEEEAAQTARHDARAEYAASLWAGAVPVNRHPYLEAKGIESPSSVRILDALPMGEFLSDAARTDTERGVLLVPVYSRPGVIRSLQAITRGKVKLNLAGGQQAGCYHPIRGTDPARVLVCEGYATGAALHAATGHSVVCAMSAKNLLTVARIVAHQAKGREVVICADNDHGTEATKGFNPGIDAGEDAAEAIGARAVWPTGCQGTDWDDWLREGGSPEQLRAIIAGEVPPPPDEGEPAAKGEPEHDGTAAGGAHDATMPVVAAPVNTVLGRISADLDRTMDPADNMPALYSEVNVGIRFAQMNEETLRWVDAWGRWMVWDGMHWVKDEVRVAFERGKKLCCAVADFARTDGTEFTTERQRQATIARYGEKRTISNVVELSKSDPRIVARSDQWDADQWALNTPGGVVDLRTGELRPGRREDYMTRITEATPRGDCPTWLQFLDVATAGDKDLQAYLQRVAGYALTGSTREHALFFVYGTGGNGKGTFLNTLQRILGDYAKSAPADMFTERKHEAHTTELARLMGARLVAAQETEEGKRWAEAKIKALTGGDPVTARFMRMDDFEFIPQFKLVMTGNHKPGLRNVDEAMKRRLHLIPFTVTVKPEDRDHELPAKLIAEADGILDWCVQGCMQWQRMGLKPSAAVLAATAEYLEQQDNLGAWLDECCELTAAFSARRGDLYKSYKEWAEDAGEYALPQKRWIAAMEHKGFMSAMLRGIQMFRGIALRSGGGFPE